MRINLFSANAASLNARAEIQTKENLADAWIKSGLDYEENELLELLHTIGGYRTGNQTHHLPFSMVADKYDLAEVSLWQMELEYACPAMEEEDIGRLPREITQQTRMLETFLGSSAFVGITPTFYTNISYRFDSEAIYTIVNLPFMRFNDPTLPFTEISGVRLTKKIGPFLQYTVVLDTDDIGRTRLDVSFRSTNALNTRLPSELLLKGNNILSMFVTELDE